MDKAWELGKGTGKLELWIYYVIVTEHNEGNYRDMRYTWMSQALKGTPGRYDGPMVYGTYDIGLQSEGPQQQLHSCQCLKKIKNFD